MIFAANFKTNHTRASAKEYLKVLDSFVKEFEIKDDIYIFPTATALDGFAISKNITIGAQNAYPAKNGSYTGEIGTEQLDEFDIKAIIIGHSERRVLLGESQEFVAKKFNYYKELGYKIIYCIGEPKEVRDEGFGAAMEYLWSEFEGIDIDYPNLIVAYEPIWAIGTGVSASKDDIKEILFSLKEKIKTPLLYGGSVKSSNIQEILSINECDGVLIGSASWSVESFCDIIKTAKNIKD